MARVLLGVSGGIAAYKALEVVRLATKAGHAVRVVQTPASQRFVGRASFAALTGAPVLTDEFERDPARGAFPDQAPPDHDPLSHLELVRNADAFLIAPASANTIAKLAHGLADNLLSSAALAATCPVLVAPAMNNHMYEHPAVQANLAALRERGVTVLDPSTGALGSKGEWGVGRLAEPPELLAAVEAAVRRAGTESHLVGLRVLVTAGGTREPIDAVRFVGNRSSGRMGFALGDEAAALGADGTVCATSTWPPRPSSRRRARPGSRPPTCCSWPPPWPTTARPRRPPRSSRRTGRRRSHWSSSAPPTSSPRWPPPAGRSRRSSASRPSTATRR